jgi:ribosomal-protein-alanine N-acetyltransferase
MPPPAGGPREHARPFPEAVPVLVDPVSGVRLRAHDAADVPRMVEQCRDPESIRWTTIPVPDGGYAEADARAYLEVVAAGWRTGTQLTWVVEAPDGPGVYGGSIDLRVQGDGLAEVGYVLHPALRGRGVMTTALRLVRDHAFDVAGLQAVRWRAVVGNWPSRRVASAAGWPCEGQVRRLLPHRGEWLDGWVGTLLATDPRAPRPWLDPPVLSGPGLRLRPFTEADVDRVVEASSDARTQRWLVSLPRSYDRRHALAYLASVREHAAQGTGLVWCVADAADDRCLGSVGLEGFGGYSRRAEIGYWAHPESRGRGVLSAATRLVTGYAEEHDLVDSLVIRAAAGNTASRHVAEAAGYRQVGVLARSEPLGDGTLADLVIYARP